MLWPEGANGRARPAGDFPIKNAANSPADAAPPRDFIAMGEATRARIVKAAFRLILEVGYHGTTTTLVQQRAGVSRGSLLNQFPTRADLMVAVSEYIIRTRSRAYSEGLRGVKDDRKRYELLVDILWDEFKKPGGLARLEITVAAASDPELHRRLLPSIVASDRVYRDLIWGLAQRLGARRRDLIDLAITSYSAALRGLAIDLLFPRPGVDLDETVDLVKRDHMRLLDDAIRAA
jgi:AcrR family transcriptional regulator